MPTEIKELDPDVSGAHRIVITLPAYHAETTLEKTVADLPAGLADELILVDDASADNTAQLARDLGISVYVHPQNLGYGGNQKTCYSKALESGADIVVLLHPDYQYDPKAVPLLIAPILAGEADMTFGSRFAGLGDPRGGGMPRYRYWGNRFTTMVENLALGTHFSEMHSGLRAYTRQCLLSLPFLDYSNDFSFDAQFLVDAVVGGQRVVEVPIPTRYTKESSSISIIRSLKYVWQSMIYAWAQSRRWGRRGKRSPVTLRPLILDSADDGGRRETDCALCGRENLKLLYPANVIGEALPEEFACTSDALASHDDIVECRDCGMISSRPTDSQARIVGNYEAMTDELYLEEQRARTELFGWVLDRVEGYWSPGRTLQEVGSNVGLFLKVAGERGWKASGVEPSRWAVQTGRDLFGVDLVPGTLQDLSNTSPVDAVVMLDVLEHLYDPLNDLRTLRKLVHDDGILALSTINVDGIHGRLRKGSWPWFIRPHLHYFNPSTLSSMLVTAGFRIVGWRNVPRAFHVSYVAERAAGTNRALARAALVAARVADPRVPLGWLGDVVMVEARPV